MKSSEGEDRDALALCPATNRELAPLSWSDDDDAPDDWFDDWKYGSDD